MLTLKQGRYIIICSSFGAYECKGSIFTFYILSIYDAEPVNTDSKLLSI